MHKTIKHSPAYLTFLTILTVGFLLSGCAASRSVVSLDQPLGGSSNPEHGTAVKITKVTDERIFEAAPKEPDTPSLSSDDVTIPALTARAIGRKRSGFGKALGDVLLPEDQTVSGLIGNALANSFRAAHYRVLTPGDDGYENAIPVQAKIVQFWSWLNPGFWEIHLHNRSEVKISGSLPALKSELIVRGEVNDDMMAVTEDDWQNIASKGLKDFSQNLVKALDEKQ